MKYSKKILVIGTSAKTRGGITAVINSYKSTEFWDKWRCVWIETHIDKSIVHKILYFIRSFIQFIVYLPATKLVHVHLSAPKSVIRKFPFLLLSKIFRIPVIIHFHAFSQTSSIDKNSLKLYRIAFNLGSSILVLSENWKKGLVSDLGLCQSRVEVLYNPCPIIKQKIEVNKTNSILYAGTLNSRKGYADLINAFASIAKIHDDWKLIFLGNGEIDKGKDLARILNIGKKVEFKGWVDGIEKDLLFRQAKIFCLPSYAEGFPMAVLDAWAYGLPVVTTPVGGIPDLAIDCVNMMIFKPGDIKKLVRKLDIMISNTDIRNKIQNESMVLANNQFSINNIVKQLNEIYGRY
jgi:glycosyltransferase involved in cell wall biosynthesis